jgi:purine-binding chemotaxis protein CheW
MADATSHQLVVFSLAGEEYALPIASVREIIRYSEPRRVASGASWIRGVIGLRGKIIPVYDLAARLRLGATTDAGKIVIVEGPAGQAGIMVDEVEGVLTVASERLEDVAGAGGDAIEAIAKIGDRLVILLDTECLFAVADDLPAAA